MSVVAISQQPSLFVITQSSGLIPDKVDSAVVSRINVTANLYLLTLENINSVSVILPDTQTVILDKRRTQYDKLNRLSWFGVIRNQPGSEVIFSVFNNRMAGYIRNDKGFVYQVIYKGDSVYQIKKINPALVNEVLDNISSESQGQDTSSQFTEPYCIDPPTSIDVMVVYSTPAASGLDAAAMTADAGLLIDMTNMSYIRSNITQRINLVHVSGINYTEVENAEIVLTNLIINGDDILDDVHNWRNTHAADIVVLIVENSTFLGNSKVMTNVSVSYEDSAFCIVKKDRAGGPWFTFSHELGHIMGARHDCAGARQEIDPPDPNLPFVFGHGFDGSNWRTIMSTNNALTKHALWSNPLINNPFNGEIMGNGNSQCGANNALALNTTASVVSRFRCSIPPINNVWMRDSWEDTGLEPDPNTAAQAMCFSPYIWVRNHRDASFSFQHDHQNPIAGSTNWVYVKLHNGGAMISGDLQIYVAKASTGLSWPADWTLVGTKSITLNSLTTSIIEFEWNDLTSAGHYCMIARWVSTADPMAFAETNNISYNTRQNNNIIWRNLNIVNLSTAAFSSATFEIKRKSEAPILLEFSDSALFPDQPFFQTGTIIVTLDSLTFNAWKKGGSISNGFKRNGMKFLVTSPTAFFANILLAPSYKGKVKIEFSKRKTTIKDKYLFVATQYEQDLIRNATEKKENKKFIGAVGYEIYTYKKK
jgi:hypothetical protein